MNEEPHDESLEQYFAESFAREEAESTTSSEKRVERIEERALFQSTLKQSTSFIFEGFSTVLTNLISSLCGHVPPDNSNNNYKP